MSKPDMHFSSKQYRRLAEVADNIGWDLVSVVGIPGGGGVYPSAVCVVLAHDGRYATTLGVLPTEVERTGYDGEPVLREAFFTGTQYGLELGDALNEMVMRAHGKVVTLAG